MNVGVIFVLKLLLLATNTVSVYTILILYYSAIQGSYSCDPCHKGYVGDPYKECVRIRYCLGDPNTNPCGEGAECIPIKEGAYYKCRVRHFRTKRPLSSPRRSAPGHIIIQGHFGPPLLFRAWKKRCAIHLLLSSIIIG